MATTSFESMDEYIAAQPEAAQPVLRRVRSIVRKAIAGAEEVISYRIPAFKVDGKGPVLWFAGWKKHYSLYPVNGSLAKELKDELAPYELSKGTLRLPLSQPVPEKLIGRIAKLRAKEGVKAVKLFKFNGRLFRPDGPGMMTVLPIPSDVVSAGGFRARQRVKGRINAVPITTSLQSSGDGWFAMVVNKELLKRLSRAPGDPVKVEMALDKGPAVVSLPPALRAALKTRPRAKAAFDRLAPSHRKAYARWVSSARRPETRDRRAHSVIQKVVAGARPTR